MKQSGPVIYYTREDGSSPITDYLDSTQKREKAKIFRVFQTIETYGLEAIDRHIKKITGTPVWEIRILGKENIRILYFLIESDCVVILHIFVKKTQKTPQQEMAFALKRYTEWQLRRK